MKLTLVPFLLFSASLGAQTLSYVGNEQVVDSINKICGRKKDQKIDETFACPGKKSELAALAKNQNKVIVAALQNYMAEIPVPARKVLQDNCYSQVSNVLNYVNCYQKNLPKAKKVSDKAWLGLDQKAATAAFNKLVNQFQVKGGIGALCDLSGAGGKLVPKKGKKEFAFVGDHSPECNPGFEPKELQVKFDYDPGRSKQVGVANGVESANAHSGVWDGTEKGYKGVCDVGLGMTKVKYSPELECKNAEEGSSLANFSGELQKTLQTLEGQDYFELLRMEALGQRIRSGRERYPVQSSKMGLPGSCAPVGLGLDQALKEKLPKKSIDKINRFASSDYKVAMQAASKRIVAELAPEAKGLTKDIKEVDEASERIKKDRVLYDQLVGEGVTYEAVERMKAEAALNLQALQERKAKIEMRLSEVNEQLAADFERYPFLLVGRDDSAPLWEGNKSVEAVAKSKNINAQFRSLADSSFKDWKQDIEKLCDPKKISDEQLLTDSALTSAVLKRFPRFQTFHQCQVDFFKSKKNTQQGLKMAAFVGCGTLVAGAGAVTLGLGYLAGGSCSSLGLLDSWTDYEKAQEKASWLGRCRVTMGDNHDQCNFDDYVSAKKEVESTLSGFKKDAAMTLALDLLMPVAGKSIKWMATSELRVLNQTLKKAETAKDLEKVALTIQKNLKKVDVSEDFALRIKQAHLALDEKGYGALKPRMDEFFASMSPEQYAAIEKAHAIGIDGVGMYTTAELKQKAKILRDAGILDQDIREAILRGGIAGKRERIIRGIGWDCNTCPTKGISVKPKDGKNAPECPNCGSPQEASLGEKSSLGHARDPKTGKILNAEEYVVEEGHEKVIAKSGDFWNCSFCTVSNYRTNSQCKSCGSPYALHLEMTPKTRPQSSPIPDNSAVSNAGGMTSGSQIKIGLGVVGAGAAVGGLVYWGTRTYEIDGHATKAQWRHSVQLQSNITQTGSAFVSDMPSGAYNSRSCESRHHHNQRYVCGSHIEHYKEPRQEFVRKDCVTVEIPEDCDVEDLGNGYFKESCTPAETKQECEDIYKTVYDDKTRTIEDWCERPIKQDYCTYDVDVWVDTDRKDLTGSFARTEREELPWPDFAKTGPRQRVIKSEYYELSVAYKNDGKVTVVDIPIHSESEFKSWRDNEIVKFTLSNFGGVKGMRRLKD